MRMRGLEPPRGCPHTALNRARLPIPPHPLAVDSVCHSPVRTMFGLRRVFLFVVVALFAGSLPALAGSSAARPPSGRRHGGRCAARRVSGRPGRVRRPPARRHPSGQGALAVPDRAQRPDRRVATDGASGTALASGCGRGLSERPLLPHALLQPRLHRRAGALGAGAHVRGERDQDRDHRRRHRSHAPVLPDRGLPNAAWISEGPARVHDRQGDRRSCVRSRQASLALRPPSVRSDVLGTCDPRGGNRGRQQRHEHGNAEPCRVSRRRPTSATTRC